MNQNEIVSRRMLRRLLACNPFYLCSAALLLWGVNRLSNDPLFLSRETDQLAFNFGALQVYELLLVGTAILLGRRALWYDSTLLVGLETGLLLAPFILVSQAALIDAHWVWGFCGGGLGLAWARGVALRRGLPQLNLPPRLLALGGSLLVANAALSVLYRILHESKFGTRPDFGAAFLTNEAVWLAALPLLVAAANLLPPPRSRNELIPGRRWLPAAFFGTLLAATAVHLWSLGYVYDFAVRRTLVAPAVWVLAWTLNRRAGDFVVNLGPRLRGSLLALPAVAALLPVTAGGHWLPTLLAGANVLLYGLIVWRRKPAPLGMALLVGSLVCVLAAAPLPGGWSATEAWGGAARWGGGAVMLALLAALILRHPLAGLAGAFALVAGVGRFLPDTGPRDYWIVLGPATLLLLHSLRWAVEGSPELAKGRWLLATVWALPALVMIGRTEADWTVSLVGLGVCLIWVVVSWHEAAPAAGAVLLAGMVVTLGAPALALWQMMMQAPGGVLILAGSLALFALGTGLALTRPLWPDEPPPPNPVAAPPEPES